MQVVFLGGASGIGASCVAVQTGPHWLLVDAGVRMDARADRLPDLAFLQDKSLAAIFVTHAHADHIGALPLVCQAFPGTPIYASRATMLLMEVMLADALQVMSKRASDALEVPLYDAAEVAATLHMLRPLPLTGSVTIPELPDVTIHTARAGHVAGAISLGFDAPDGRLVISGDLSITPQRTVAAAALIGLPQPDLLVLESTYGARLHPNRQAEEERLAQAVADGIARSGHVLIPAFALGRAQEVLRILHEAQRRGRIPEFPIWVDGLVRTVCATYTALPEALTPTLERQIRKGYSPFFTGMIRAVGDARQREQIMQGSPACIVSSSGMLVGGPSAVYAAQLAPNPANSILITGYQDEESPGRRLLALADDGGGTLEIAGQTVPVRCHFDRYNLSAHADGSELAGMVGALKPKTVALVHGDGEARLELARRLERLCGVVMPSDGETLAVGGQGATGRAPRDRNRALPSQEAFGLAAGQPLTREQLPRLWQAVTTNTEEQVVSVWELALAWYGPTADAAAEAVVRPLVMQEQPFFVPHPDLPTMVRVRTAAEVESSTAQPDRADHVVEPGKLLLIQAYGDQVLPALCLDANAEVVRALLASGVGQRTRFPRPNVLEVLGTWPDYPVTDVEAARQALADISKAAQQWQRQHPLRKLVATLDAERAYTLDEVWQCLGVAADDLVGRLAVGLLLTMHPQVIEQTMTTATLPRPCYRVCTGPKAEQALVLSDPRPDQMLILTILERHLGTPPDLYKRSVNPDTGAVTLSFHFPDVARRQYGEALAAAAAEAGVQIDIYSQPHQGALSDMARAVLPPGLQVQKTSLHHDRHTIALRCSGKAAAGDIQTAKSTFYMRTGWHLDLEGVGMGNAREATPQTRAAGQPAMDMNEATTLVKSTLGAESGCYKVSADQGSRTLTVRFFFPDVAGQRYAATLTKLEARTGWRITVYPEPHQAEMEMAVRRVLPPEVRIIGAPSLYRGERQVIVRCRGALDPQTASAAQAAFAAKTGWQLVVRVE